MNAKTLIIAIAILLAIGFISVFFMMIPWLNYNPSISWKTIMIDNVIIIAVAGVGIFGFYVISGKFSK